MTCELTPLRPFTRAPDPTRACRARLRLESLVGRSAALAAALQRLAIAAPLDRLAVLFTGESGTGKSLLARILHQNSPRCEGPLVEVNCAAIPSALFEAEFFGCARHAYTQAAPRAGRFAAAEGGTLLLDEIAEMPLEQQAKLLRVLDEGRYERLGEDETRRADVRIVAATNRDVDEEVARGRLRADLVFRLDRFRIHVPALRERRADIPELARALAERECKALGLPAVPLADETARALAAGDWPGNVRELQSAVARALFEALADGAHAIRPEHLEPPREPGRALPAHATAALPGAPTLRDALADFKRHFLREALAEEHWNMARTARRLGLSRSHLYGLLTELSIDVERP